MGAQNMCGPLMPILANKNQCFRGTMENNNQPPKPSLAEIKAKNSAFQNFEEIRTGVLRGSSAFQETVAKLSKHWNVPEDIIRESLLLTLMINLMGPQKGISMAQVNATLARMANYWKEFNNEIITKEPGKIIIPDSWPKGGV